MRLTQLVIDRLVSRMSPPTGIWRDFEHDFNFYIWLTNLAKNGLIKDSDLPPQPMPTDYTDLNSAKTREN